MYIYLRTGAFFHRRSSTVYKTSFACWWLHSGSLSFVWRRLLGTSSLLLHKLAVSTHQVVWGDAEKNEYSTKKNSRTNGKWPDEGAAAAAAAVGCNCDGRRMMGAKDCGNELTDGMPMSCACTVRSRQHSHRLGLRKIPTLNIKSTNDAQTLCRINAIYGDANARGMIELIHL